MFDIKITKKIILILFLSLPVFANAHPMVDVYGTDEKTASKIVEYFGNDINLLAQCVLEDPEKQSLGCKPENKLKAKEKITTGIKKLKNFQFIYFSSIYYGNQSLFTTVDVIESTDQKRLNYFPNYIRSEQLSQKIQFKRDKNLEELLMSWHAYNKQGEALFRKGIQFDEEKNCPAYHCLYDFTHPDLKYYKEIFERDVPKNKQNLIKTLRTDPDEEKRGAAAFLLAHIKNGSELIKILTPSLLDSSAHVRNNAMRVLSSALPKVNPKDFEIDPIIEMLNAPVLTDRNKALCIIASLSVKPKYKKYIAQHAGEFLMTSLKMKQPNLHNPAYLILRNVSNRTYDERDYVAWQNWLNSFK